MSGAVMIMHPRRRMSLARKSSVARYELDTPILPYDHRNRCTINTTHIQPRSDHPISGSDCAFRRGWRVPLHLKCTAKDMFILASQICCPISHVSLENLDLHYFRHHSIPIDPEHLFHKWCTWTRRAVHRNQNLHLPGIPKPRTLRHAQGCQQELQLGVLWLV